MKKVLSLVLLLLMVGVFAGAQQFGSIKGTVNDADGNALPGVAVTLNSSKIAPMTTISSERGNFRFMSLPVASDYVLRLELPGFKTVVKEELVVVFGRDVILSITMEMSAIEEEITVVGETPVIDTKRTQVGVSVTKEMIMSLPTARNPWTILQMLPGMLIDREDVGGNEGGQQSSYYGHGASDGDSTWSIDGGNVTDNSALGAAPAYYSLASYEQIQFNYGNNDVLAQTGGVQINIVSKRGGNDYSGTFYLDVERNAWQAENIPDELVDIGYKGAGINRVYLYGVNFGGPIIKDKLWFYGSWDIQDLDALTLAGTSDKTWLTSSYGKLDFQITPSTRANFFLEYDNKNKWGRTAWGSTMQSSDTLWNQSGPNYSYKFGVEQMFGNLFIDAKVIFVNGGFHLEPTLGARTPDGSGPYETRQYYPSFYVSGNVDDYGCDRNQLNVNVTGNMFLEGILGGDHEFKFGVDYLTAVTTTFDYYEGNLSLAYYGLDPTVPTGEWWEAWLVRDYLINYSFTRYSAFIQDTVSVGRLAINLGLRYDQESCLVKDENIPVSPWLPTWMPGAKLDEFDSGAKWKVFSPRFSLIYDIFGNGKDVLKFSFARYGSQSGMNLASFTNPLGWTEIDVLWQDLNGDGRVTSNELFGYNWDTYSVADVNNPAYWLWYSGVNTTDPSSMEARNKFDPDYNSPVLTEISASYEKELFTDFAARLEFFYKKSTNQTWTKGMMPDGTIEDQSNYYLAGHNDVTDYDYYGRYHYYPYRYRTNHEERYDRYVAAQIVLTKRLSNKWMLDASFTYADWKRFYKEEYVDPQNVEYYNEGVVAPESGASGLTDIFVNSRWMFKISGLYQLPLGLNFSGIFLGREGYVIPTYVLVVRPGIGSGRSLYGNEGGGGKMGDTRLPSFFVLNFRLEKVFQVTEGMRVILSADAFNLLNSATSMKKQASIVADRFMGDLRILNPRVLRFGARFNF